MAMTEIDSLIQICDDFLEATYKTAREKELEPIYQKMKKKLAKGFKEQGKVFLENFKQHKKLFDKPQLEEALGEDQVYEELSKTFSITYILLKAPIEEGLKEAIEKGGMESITQIDIGLDFQLDHPEAVDYIQKRGSKAISQIDETTRRRINNIVQNGIKNGHSYDRTAENIMNEFESMAVGRPQQHIDSRAHHIAITETGEAFETGNEIGAKQIEEMGIQIEKSWHTVGDSRVSDGCAENEADGWIPRDQPHSSGDMRPLRFPGCRCHEQYRRQKEENYQQK